MSQKVLDLAKEQLHAWQKYKQHPGGTWPSQDPMKQVAAAQERAELFRTWLQSARALHEAVEELEKSC